MTGGGAGGGEARVSVAHVESIEAVWTGMLSVAVAALAVARLLPSAAVTAHTVVPFGIATTPVMMTLRGIQSTSSAIC